MDLAQRLRKARLEAGLSQKQVCGEVITRNMLSQIENGSATPSVATLQYLAGRLGKTVGYLLGEPGEAIAGFAVLEQARQAYASADPARALRLLEGEAPEPAIAPEWQLLQYLSTLELARRELSRDCPLQARRLLEDLEGREGLYIAAPLRRERLRLLAQSGHEAPLPPDDLPLLLRARSALARGAVEEAVLLLSAAQDQAAPQWQLLRGHADFRRQRFRTAAACYRRAEEAYPKEVIPLLETCYKEMGDFQQAYAYAIKRRAL